MGAGVGGAVTIDLPMIQFKTSSPSSSPSLPSSSSSCCSSSDSSSPKFPVPVNKSVSLRQSCTVASSRCSIGSGSRIDCVHGEEDKRPGGSLFDAILRQVPSRFEVESAIAALRDFVEGIPSLGVEFHWLLRILYSSVSVLQAFRSLETEPSVKRLVISLATDKAVWDAILNNEMVRTLRDSGNTGFKY
uniref:Uncharacterized protein LOC8265826 n=1 Tax=Rhizophora mucronata TaxID=61149 RepID=A0A2P2JZZ2_RHIMU